MRAELVASAGLAVVVLITLSSSVGIAGAAAPTPLFTFAPSYASNGAHAYVGSRNVTVSGNGANQLVVNPSFLLASGQDSQKSSSTTARPSGGTFIFLVWSGVRDLSFSCTSACSANGSSISMVWNVTWSSVIHDTRCMPGTGYSETSLSLQAKVVDTSTATPTVVGSGHVSIYKHKVTLAGKPTKASKVDHRYSLSFPVSLTSGDAYSITAFVQAETQTGGYACGLLATVTVGGSAGTTTLESVAVY